MTGSIGSERALADTNVVVYAYDPTEAARHERAQALLHDLSDAGRLVFSTQVLNEFCSVMMRPNRPGRMLPGEVAEVIRELSATGEVLLLTPTMTLLALEAMPRHGFSFWDALIWAAACENDVSIVYSEDFQHDRVIEGVRYQNPFLDD